MKEKLKFTFKDNSKMILLVFRKEKEHLLPLPNDKVCSFYKNVTTSAKVNINALFKYKQNMYSVPPELIDKTICRF